MNFLDSFLRLRCVTALVLVASSFTASALDLVKGRPVATIVTTASPDAFGATTARPAKGAKKPRRSNRTKPARPPR